MAKGQCNAPRLRGRGSGRALRHWCYTIVEVALCDTVYKLCCCEGVSRAVRNLGIPLEMGCGCSSCTDPDPCRLRKTVSAAMSSFAHQGNKVFVAIRSWGSLLDRRTLRDRHNEGSLCWTHACWEFATAPRNNVSQSPEEPPERNPIHRLREAPKLQRQPLPTSLEQSRNLNWGPGPARVPNPRPGKLWSHRKRLSLTGKCRDLPCPLTKRQQGGNLPNPGLPRAGDRRALRIPATLQPFDVTPARPQRLFGGDPNTPFLNNCGNLAHETANARLFSLSLSPSLPLSPITHP